MVIRALRAPADERELARLARQPADDRRKRPVFRSVDLRPPTGDLVQLLAAAAHASTAGLMITDGDLERPGPTVLYVNPAFEAMTGYRADDIVGLSPRVLQGPGTNPEVLQQMRTDLATDGYFSGETVNYRSNGEPFVMAWQIRAMPGPDGQASHFVAVQSDVTAERLREEAEQQSARRLQQEMLPQVPPSLGPVELVARYEPAESQLAIGGDWYDALDVGNGRVALVVGDIAGHGVLAAAAMGRLRWSVRSLLATGLSLEETVGHVRDFAMLDDMFATAAIAILDTNDRTLEVTTLGHPPVLLWSPTGVREVWTPNPLLGLESTTFRSESLTLGHDEIVVLYTDGLLDGGRRGHEWLSTVLDNLDPHIDRTLTAIVDEVIAEMVTSGTDDDAALLLARMGPLVLS